MTKMQLTMGTVKGIRRIFFEVAESDAPRVAYSDAGEVWRHYIVPGLPKDADGRPILLPVVDVSTSDPLVD